MSSGSNPMKNPNRLTPVAFIATDRVQAMVRGEDLPPTMDGAVLFADITGYTSLVEQVENLAGPVRGADVMAVQINQIFELLITEIYRYGGGVVGFGGDAIMAWFPDNTGLRAIASGFAMQQAMQPFKQVTLLENLSVSFTIKISVAAGRARRFGVGDPAIQQLDVLAGDVIAKLATVQRVAINEQIVVAGDLALGLEGQLRIARWFSALAESAQQFAVVTGLNVERTLPDPPTDHPLLPAELGRPWVLQPIYERVLSGEGRFTAEIRPVVVLFFKFTGIDYVLDEQAGAKLNAYLNRIQQVLRDEGGYLIKLTIDDKGSYLLATFGAPLTQENDTQRALKTALRLCDLSNIFPFIQGSQIGVSQGRMLAGIFGTPQRAAYDLQGNQATIANRLMSLAKPGQILVTKSVVDGAKSSFSFATPTAMQVKGIAGPIPVYELLAHLPPGLPTFPRRLLGRQDELQQLYALCELVHNKQGQVLEVVGPAGVGKSHLVAYFLERIKPQKYEIVYGNCESTSQNIAYYPWRQVLRVLQGWGEQESTAWFAEMLEASVGENAAATVDHPVRHQEKIFAAFSELIKEGANRRPLILVFEDIQWIDEVSLKLTVAISRQSIDLPVFLIVTRRPVTELTGLPVAELTAGPHCHSLNLAELSPADVKELLVDRLSANVSPLVLSFLLAVTQGNAFFLEEQLSTLKALGRLAYDPHKHEYTLAPALFQSLQTANCLGRDIQTGDWKIATGVRLSTIDLGIPNTVEQSILARIDRLPETHRLTLKTASVIGRTFTSALLSHAHPGQLDVEGLQQQLQTLQESSLVVLEATLPATTYAFKHQLTQETTYKTLPEADQRRLHCAVAAALEELDPEAVEALADHYWQGGVSGKSLIYLEKAATKAQNSYANQAALNYLNRALSIEERKAWLMQKIEVLHILGQRPEEEATLKKATSQERKLEVALCHLWAEYYESIGDFESAKDFIRRARKIWIGRNDQHGEIRCLISLGLIARRKADYKKAQKWQELAQKYLSATEAAPQLSSTTPLLIKVYSELGALYRQQGKYQQAIVACEKAYRLSQESGNRRGGVEALNILGGIALYLRKFDESLRYHRQALTMRRTIGDLAGEGTTLYNLGAAEYEYGNYSTAESYFVEALNIQRITQNRWEEVNLQNVLGVLSYQLGDFDDAETWLRSALALSQQITDKGGEASALCNLGQVLRDRGNTAAETMLRRGLSMARRQADKHLLTMCQSHLAVTYLESKQFQKAIQLAQQAMTARVRIGAIELTTIDHTTLAMAFWETARHKRALAHVRQAYQLLLACNHIGPEFPQRDYFLCAQIWQAAEQYTQAEAALRAAYQELMARAEKISDLQKRAAFLQNVPWHAQIVQASQQGRISRK
jgi:class 3 adenylate cyclase/tetratricopeptide (TPR) repeat protein